MTELALGSLFAMSTISLLGWLVGWLLWVCCFKALVNEPTQTFLVGRLAQEPELSSRFHVAFGWCRTGLAQGLLLAYGSSFK